MYTVLLCLHYIGSHVADTHYTGKAKQKVRSIGNKLPAEN